MTSPRLLVLSVAHDVADARIHRLVDRSLQRGLDVEVWARGDSADAPPGARVRILTRRSRVARLCRTVLAPKSDVLVVVDPDLFPMALVARLARRARIVVSDVHEDFVAVASDRAWIRPILRPFVQGVVRFSLWCAARADITLVADDHVPPIDARDRHVVTNDSTMFVRPANPPTPHRAVYVGDIRRSRGCIEIAEAVRASPPWSLDMVGPIADQEDRLALEEIAADCGRITLWGRQEPRRSWEIAAQSSVGLCVLDATPAFTEAVPTKVYEYMAGGMAVIASPLPRVRALLAETGAGVLASDRDEIAAVLARWVENPSEMATLRSAAWSWRSGREDGDPFDDVLDRVRAYAKRTEASQ